MNFVMFPLALAPIAEMIVQHWDPPMVLLGKLLAIAVLVMLNGFFVAAEFALVKIRTSHLKTMAASGSKRAVLLRAIKDNLNAYLSACQVGITMASLGLLVGNLSCTNASAAASAESNLRRGQIDFVRTGFSAITFLPSWWANKHQRFWRSAGRCRLRCS
jgi:CBS domain containing-hemolysin-like protein